MKKLILTLMMVLCLSITGVMAEGNTGSGETETIQDEATPEAGRRNNNMVYMAGAAVLFVVVVYLSLAKKKEPESQLYISAVESNEDGTYTVKCGIHAKKNLSASAEKSEIQIKKGNAIVIRNNVAQADQSEALITIVDEQTELDWVLGEESLKINKDSIHTKS